MITKQNKAPFRDSISDFQLARDAARAYQVDRTMGEKKRKRSSFIYLMYAMDVELTVTLNPSLWGDSAHFRRNNKRKVVKYPSATLWKDIHHLEEQKIKA